MSSSRDHRKQLYERLVGQPVANGRFVITRLLGFGGMGAVYEALQKNMDRKVALKLIPTHDPTIVARFEREALTISKLQHPNTITVFDFGQSEDGFLYLSMELLEGKTLTEEIKDGPMQPKRAVHIASQMCRSLAEAHRAGIVHRDIKPDNIILIRVDDDPNVVKVLDFGIAKAVMGEDDVQLTGDGRIIGTPRYMSPEQILAEPLDHRSDIYSLGCILFEMLCGAPPFQQSSTTALMISHTQDPPPSFSAQLDTGLLTQMPSGLERVVRRALAKSPQDRPADCDQLREELETAMAGLAAANDRDSFETVGAVPMTTSDRPLQTSTAAMNNATNSTEAAAHRRSSAPLVAGIIAAAVVIVGLLVIGAKNSAEPEPIEPVAVVDLPVQPTPPAIDDSPPEEPPAKPEGVAIATLKISSVPEGATILSGDVHLGKTPMSIPVAAELKRHAYRLVLESYEDLDIAVDVTPADEGANVVREFELKPLRTQKRPPSNTKTKPPKATSGTVAADPVKIKTKAEVKRLEDGPTATVPLLPNK